MRATATEGPSGLHRQTYAKARRLRPPSAQTAYAEGVLSKKNAAEDGFVEGFRIQQFLKFRFSKGTNAELKLRSTLQQSAGLVVF